MFLEDLFRAAARLGPHGTSMGTPPGLPGARPEGRGLRLRVRVRGRLSREGLVRRCRTSASPPRAAAGLGLVLGRRREGEHGLPSFGSLWPFKHQPYQLLRASVWSRLPGATPRCEGSRSGPVAPGARGHLCTPLPSLGCGVGAPTSVREAGGHSSLGQPSERTGLVQRPRPGPAQRPLRPRRTGSAEHFGGRSGRQQMDWIHDTLRAQLRLPSANPFLPSICFLRLQSEIDASQCEARGCSRRSR